MSRSDPVARLLNDVTTANPPYTHIVQDSGTEMYKQHSNRAASEQQTSRRTTNGYMPVRSSNKNEYDSTLMLTTYVQIEDYGLIGNMRTCAMVATDGGLDYMCWYAPARSSWCMSNSQGPISTHPRSSAVYWTKTMADILQSARPATTYAPLSSIISPRAIYCKHVI